MNFIITHNCNKGCPYCFASSTRKNIDEKHRDMDFETFYKLLNKETGHVKLLGGEPTQHPRFKDFVNEVERRGKKFTLVSNFLFNEETLEFIKSKINKMHISFLINATDLDKDNRMEIWSRNYNEIYKELYKVDKEEAMSIGFTITEDKKDEYYVKYLNYIRRNILNIERLRLSIAFPGDKENKEDFFFINNKNLGKKFLIIIRHALDNGIKTSIDCIIFPCMFSNKEEWKFLKKFKDKTVNTKCGIGGAPADVFPDRTISFCYPLKSIISLNTDKYANSKELVDDMNGRYRIIYSKVEKPEECKKCSHFEKGFCNGPCLGFYNLEEETLGINY